MFNFNKNLMHSLILILLLFTSLSIRSEVYQWTDNNGNTHFGDRPPVNSQSEDISSQVKQINISRDLSSPEMMLRHEQKKEKEEKKLRDAWQEEVKNRPTMAEKCKEAQQFLRTIKGRVIFVDEQGKDLKISEVKRKQRAKQLEDNIRKNCI